MQSVAVVLREVNSETKILAKKARRNFPAPFGFLNFASWRFNSRQRLDLLRDACRVNVVFGQQLFRFAGVWQTGHGGLDTWLR
jgi:hypothetical protein